MAVRKAAGRVLLEEGFRGNMVVTTATDAQGSADPVFDPDIEWRLMG